MLNTCLHIGECMAHKIQPLHKHVAIIVKGKKICSIGVNIPHGDSTIHAEERAINVGNNTRNNFRNNNVSTTRTTRKHSRSKECVQERGHLHI